MNQEYYKDLSLPPIPHKNKKSSTRPQSSQKDYETQLHTYIGLLDNSELKQKLKTTLDKFLMTCSAKHDNLIDALITLDQSNQSLERRLCSQTDQCKKAQRDAAAYKTRYEHIQRRRSNSSQVDINRRKASLISSNASCFSGTSYTTATNSSASILSSSSSSYTQLSQVTDIIGSNVGSSSSAASTIFWYDPEQDREGRGDDDFSIDFASVLSDQDSLSLPLEPRPPKDASPTPPVSPFYDKSQHREMESMEHEYSPSPHCSPFIFNQHTCEPCESKPVTLKFGCGDGFWNVIAKSKSNKKEVEDMIRYYRNAYFSFHYPPLFEYLFLNNSVYFSL
jgi:hypothetical protein